MSRTVTMHGVPKAVEGEERKVGQPVPNFTIDERTIKGIVPVSLTDFKGKVLLLNVVTSLDTSVCATQIKKVSQMISELPDNVEVLTVSMDLPAAQGRFADAEGITKMRFASDHREENFASALGVMVRPLRLLQRSLFVVDQEGILQYSEYVPEIVQEPNYEPAFAKAKELAGE